MRPLNTTGLSYSDGNQTDYGNFLPLSTCPLGADCVSLPEIQEGCPYVRAEIIPYELDAVRTAERTCS